MSEIKLSKRLTKLTLIDVCVSSLRRGHADALCTVPSLTDDPRRGNARCQYQRVRSGGA